MHGFPRERRRCPRDHDRGSDRGRRRCGPWIARGVAAHRCVMWRHERASLVGARRAAGDRAHAAVGVDDLRGVRRRLRNRRGRDRDHQPAEPLGRGLVLDGRIRRSCPPLAARCSGRRAPRAALTRLLQQSGLAENGERRSAVRVERARPDRCGFEVHRVHAPAVAGIAGLRCAHDQFVGAEEVPPTAGGARARAACGRDPTWSPTPAVERRRGTAAASAEQA